MFIVLKYFVLYFFLVAYAVNLQAQSTESTDGAAMNSSTEMNAATENCDTCKLDRFKFLRRLSLDLRNQLPSYEEFMALENTDNVPLSVIESFIDSEQFQGFVDRFHANLLWPSLTLTKLSVPAFVLVERGGSGRALDIGGAAGAKRRRAWRGDADISCLDQLQEEFVSVSEPIPYVTPKPINTWEENGKEIRQEGYVLVSPYWAPDTVVKVCAFAAQAALETPEYNSDGELRYENDPESPDFGQPRRGSCVDGDGFINPLCGCGENLRTCFGPGVEKDVQNQLALQLMRTIQDHTVDERPYSEMLTTSRVWSNGTIGFWSKYLSLSTSLNREFNRYSQGDADIPNDVNFADKNWVLANRNEVDGRAVDTGHSGILTLPAYSLRFQTNRSRANRFRIVFTGQYFVPPDNPDDTENCSQTASDLTQRCVCRGCHQILEPLAAHWGVVAEGGSSLLSDREIFPLFRQDCIPEGADGSFDGDNYDVLALRKEYCPRFWVADLGQENLGVLKPYQFAYVPEGDTPETHLDELHLSIFENLESGPKALAQSTIADGLFHRAMAQHLFEYFMGRNMKVYGEDVSEVNLLATLGSEFRQHDSFKEMVKRIVLLDEYRRVR